jgi:anti-anti-sigma factor
MTTLRPQPSAPDAFRVAVRHPGRRTDVIVEGELDVTTAGELSRALTVEIGCGGTVLLDLRGVSFVDASGVGILLRAGSDARRCGTLLLLAPGEPVRRLLELLGLSADFAYGDPSSP